MGFGGLNQQMPMVVHQTVGVTDPFIPGDNTGKRTQKVSAIVISKKEFMASIAARGEMINSPGNSGLNGRAMPCFYNTTCWIARPDPNASLGLRYSPCPLHWHSPGRFTNPARTGLR